MQLIISYVADRYLFTRPQEYVVSCQMMLYDAQLSTRPKSMVTAQVIDRYLLTKQNEFEIICRMMSG